MASYLSFGPLEALFRPNEIEAYNFVHDFVKKHAALPTTDTVEAHTSIELTPHTEPATYYLDLLKKRHIEGEVKKAIKQADEHLKTEGKDPEAALKVLMDMALKVAMQRKAHQVFDFRQAYDLIIPTYAQQLSEDQEGGLYLGWPTLDNMTGGLRAGDLLSMVGRPQKGKTWQMLYAAWSGWNVAGKKFLAQMAAAGADVQAKPVAEQSRLFVSMEMQPLAIEQRLAAMQTSINASNLKLAQLGTISQKKLKKGLTEIRGFGAPFWVVDGNLTAMVEDIWVLVRQLKPDATFVDGGYLLKHPREQDRFRRVAENADLLKSQVAPLCPVCASWQFAKTAAKKNPKKGEKVDLEDIGYSDAIAQVSSIVLGLLDDDNIETLLSKLIDILKGRNGEVGQFRTRWNFDVCDFTEIEKEDVNDLQFV